MTYFTKLSMRWLELKASRGIFLMPNIPVPRIVCLGDSISQYGWRIAEGGFVGLLAECYSPKADVICRGLSGFTSETLLHYMSNSNLLDTLDCRGKDTSILYVTVCIGANDASAPKQNPIQSVNIAEYRRNLVDILAFIHAAGVPYSRIIVIAPPPIADPAKYPCLCEKGKSPLLTEEYASACLDIAKEVGCRHTDIRPLWDGIESIWIDGLHMNRTGNKLLFQAIMNACGADLRPESIPFPWVHWSQYKLNTMERD